MQTYPKWSEKLESSIQIVIGIALLGEATVFFTVRDAIFGPDAIERIGALSEALKILAFSFFLAVTATFFRRWTKQDPKRLIWSGLLLAAIIAAVSASLQFIAFVGSSGSG